MRLAPLFLLGLAGLTAATELTFEMEPSDTNCFVEEMKAEGQKLTLEYQVVYGGQVGKLDIDVTIEGPDGDVLYKEQRKTFDDVEITTKKAGPYKVCFSNEFSTFSHKTIYFDLFLDEGADPLEDTTTKEATALTQMADFCRRIHRSLRQVVDAQTHHRVNEIQGRNLAEDLNTRVKMWSFFQALLMVVCSVVQVYLVRRLFDTNKSSY
eukprot:comp33414_c0_seq1/m.47281 comp33414_c0_seq1/g.47281  ORF comp33414_c0_seq1/g.47281 comp33414_c0_seq1/m.47281 type:complete len:209 (-) comp33414_c0_seq1:109-735(-)